MLYALPMIWRLTTSFGTCLSFLHRQFLTPVRLFGVASSLMASCFSNIPQDDIAVCLRTTNTHTQPDRTQAVDWLSTLRTNERAPSNDRSLHCQKDTSLTPVPN